MEWRDSEPRAKFWGIEFDFSDGAAAVKAKSPGKRPQIGPIDERCAKAGAVTPQLRPEEAEGHRSSPTRRRGRRSSNGPATGR